jgi:alginate O-acetyltransferase complex protein AlgI
VLGGLWHGAAWHYVAWGAYHGALLVGEHALGPRIGVGPAWLRRFVTFNLMAAGFVIFRAPSLADVAAVAAGLVRGPLALPPGALGTAALVVVAAALHVAPSATRARAAFARLPPALQGAAYAMLAAGLFLSSPATQGFIYFQF